MAVPRVFVSSTFYDLRQVRNNIGDFIRLLGYEPVMHEKSGVAYTQNTTLETDCYNEILSCDIVICIIGNHFGTKADKSELSITMNELEIAIKNKKKIYIFIAKDVFIENRTYQQNKENGNFKPAYTDDIKIHDFILYLKEKIKNNVIEPFETTDEIISTLKHQFAGLFQNLLTREANLTDAKTAYDLQQTADSIKDLINSFTNDKEDFFKKFDSSIFTTNVVLKKIGFYLGMKKSLFFAKNIEALDEFMSIAGFESVSVDNQFEDYRKYVCIYTDKTATLIMKNELFDDDNLVDIRNIKKIEDLLIWSEEERELEDDDLPF